MRTSLATKLVSLTLVASFLPPLAVFAGPHKDHSVKVNQVLSGDKIQVDLDGESKTIIIIGVDAPNRIGPKTKAECFNKEAWTRARKLVEGSSVTLEEDPTQGDEDKDGNLLRNVFIADGRLFGDLMIRDGYARAIKAKKPSAYQARFLKDQTQAMTAKKGLWAANTCAGLLQKKK